MSERLDAAEYKAVFSGRSRSKMPDAVLAAQAAAFDAAAESCLWTQDWVRLAACASAPRPEAHGAMRAVDSEIRVAQLEDALRIVDAEAAAAPWWRCSKKRQADDIREGDSSSDDSNSSDIPVATDAEMDAEDRAAAQACAVEEAAVRELEARRPARAPYYVRSTLIKPAALAERARILTGDQSAIVTSDSLRELIHHLTTKVSALVRDAIALDTATRRPHPPGAPPRRIRMSSVHSALAVHGLSVPVDASSAHAANEPEEYDFCSLQSPKGLNVDSPSGRRSRNGRSQAHLNHTDPQPSAPGAERLLISDNVFSVLDTALSRTPGSISPS